MTQSSPEVTLCALLPVHAGAEARHLKAALDAISAQERPADEVIIVEDGPLTPDLYATIDEYSNMHPECVRVRLPSNRGPGVARQSGLEAARSEWIALVDSDDISVSERFRIQLDAALRLGADMLGGAMLEFVGTTDSVIGRRALPESPEAILRYARLRAPVNNSTVMFRRQAALDLGGYRDLVVNEDYDLTARFLAAGHVVCNMSENLVLCRTGDGMFGRRRAWATHHAEVQLQNNLYHYGLIGYTRSRLNLAIRMAYRLLPTGALSRIYPRLFLDASSQPTAAPS